MNRAILALVFSTSVAMADFVDDQYVDQPEVLSRITAAAEKYGEPLRSTADGTSSYYLRSAEYVGPCEAPFGTVHVARLFFIRSAVRGSKSPARGHTFIVFLDRDFGIRAYWSVEHTVGRVSVSGTKLLLDDAQLFDYAHPPARGEVVVDGAVQQLPQWK